MTALHVLSRSASFERHLAGALATEDPPCIFDSPEKIPAQTPGQSQILLVHAPSFRARLSELLSRGTRSPGRVVGIAADVPNLDEMLAVSRYGVRAYFNSYMADAHYQQMIRLLGTGQTWFPPQLLASALKLARGNLENHSTDASLQILTPREKDVALAVAEGMSNKKIASTFGIAERTVKTHLTRIFEKLEIKDRVSLAIKLRTPPPRMASEG
jgi:two-component system, NarL family, nitrate/nitrite response regulator NarL